MPYCPSCLVGLAEQTPSCPLCGALPVKNLQDALPASPVEPAMAPFATQVHNAEEREKLSPREVRKMTVELLSVSMGIALIMTLVIDFVLSRGITWSRFTSVALIMLWLYSAIPLILWKHPWLVFSVLGPSTLLGVFLWMVSAGRIDWFMFPGLPLTVLVEGVLVASGVLISVLRHKGLNSVGIILAAASLLCLGIDAILSLFITGTFTAGWSVVFALSAFPVGGLFFYLHHRVTNRASLRKLFRL